MIKDVFYAIVKLVSGEEILSKVCAFEEDDEILIVLDNPIIVNLMVNPKSKLPLVKVSPWINLSTDTTHIIRRNHVITMTEVKDENMVRIHNQYVNDLNPSSKTSNSNRGSIININDARKSLEELYNSKESHSNFD